MKLFKRFASIVLMMLVVVVSTTGCGSTWWQDFKSNPVAKVQVFETTVQSAMSIADVTWNSVKVYLPPDVSMRAQAKYDVAVVAVNHAIGLLNDAVQVAAETQNTTPDFSKLIQAVSDAVTQVIGVINEFKGMAAPAQLGAGVAPKPAAPLGYDDLQSVALTMHRVGGTK